MYRCFDHYFSNEKKVKEHFPDSLYLPTAGSLEYCKWFNEDVLKDERLDNMRCDILHLGAIYSNRIKFLIEIAPMVKAYKLKMIITGVGSDEGALPDELKEFYKPVSELSSDISLERGGTLNHADTIMMYNCSKYVLNINRDAIRAPKAHSSNLRYKIQATSLNPRCYEVPMSGSILCTDKSRSEYAEVFTTKDKDQNCVAFNSPKDFINQIVELEKDEERRKQILNNGHGFCTRNHSYKNRATRLLKFIWAKEGNPEKSIALLMKQGVGVK